MKTAGDPIFRAETLTALCLVFLKTDWPLLARAIAILQRDTRIWLRQHPEHVRAFCDAYYERREETGRLAAEITAMPEEHPGWRGCNGIWTILGRRYESVAAHEKRMADAGFTAMDLDELTKDWTEEQRQKHAIEMEEYNRRVAEDIATGRDQDRPMNYSFWLPDREEDCGEFIISIPKRYARRMDRIQDYRYAGGRFPTTEFTEYFVDLRASDVISEGDLRNLMRWVAYENLPKIERESMKEKSLYRPITDLPGVTRARTLLSDFDDETDELDDRDPIEISLSRQEAAKILAALGGASDQSSAFQKMMGKFRRSLDTDDPA